TRRAHSLVPDRNRAGETVFARILDADPPGVGSVAGAAREEVAAGLDRIPLQVRELARGEVDGQALSNGAQIEKQRPPQRHRSLAPVETHITEGRVDGLHNQLVAGNVVAAQPPTLLDAAYRWIECSARRPREVQREGQRPEQQRAALNRDAGLPAEA